MRLQLIYLFRFILSGSIFIFGVLLYSQSDDFENSHAKKVLHNYTIADSLPDNIPPMKNFLWGKNGIIRKTPFKSKSRVQELKTRRNMLQLHQKLALVTLGLMSYQYYLGNKMIDNPEEYMEVEPTHMKLGYTTFGTYMTSASLSIFSPPASKYSNRLSSNKIHKYLAIIHFAGMCIQPWLGYETYKSRILDDGNYDKYLDLHQQVGGITVTCYALAFLTTLLPY